MADYWKSQAKKFCDFCKCWIADNKPSVGFHESGKRHKENVAKRLSEISKNSAKHYHEELQVDKEMKKMEQDALKAYMKDLEENPDFTSRMILEKAEKRKKELEESLEQENKATQEPELNKPEVSQMDTKASKSKDWHEAKSDEGYTYYWNINTAESKWEPPIEGFLSIKEQEQQHKEAVFKKEENKTKKEEKNNQKQEEEKALKENEHNRKKRKKEKDDKKEEETVIIGPSPRAEPYGPWTVVEHFMEEPLDLQLPVQEYVAINVTEYREPDVKFKEKTVSSLEDDNSQYGVFKKESEDFSASSFKKRKVIRGNARQKLDTD